MSLFQKSVLNKYLKAQDQKQVKEAYQRFTDFFHNPEIIKSIIASKEEQFQYGFLENLFDKVLDYTINPKPNFDLTTELKNLKGSKKADGAIMKDDKAIGVIELKGTKTKDLNKITEQAFGYKNNHPTCVYIVTSNFEKLRFYINDAVEYEEFNLFSLTEDRFALLYLCLYKGNIFLDLPQKIKNESTLKEEEITKELYKHYSEFKRTLFNNIIELNPNQDKLFLFKKTQKLLDRFLFIFFAEDKGLLPPNSITAIIDQWESLKDLDEYQPLYNRFIKFFNYLDKGYKGKKFDISAFNGGLFAIDETLDNLKINDDIIAKYTKEFSAYDFESEVDVNILGHIFEHSLNEIEEITAQLEGKAVDKSKTKRKKDGVFYTPKYITKYIVDNTVGKLCQEKKEELELIEIDFSNNYKTKKRRTTKEGKKTNLSVEGEKILKALNTYRDYLLDLTICDPACGSGAFLNQALDFLIKAHHEVDEMQTKLMGGSIVFPDVEAAILENNLYGVDINDESVDIAKLSLWLRTAKKGRILTTLNNNIKCGNSLIDDKSIAGGKAFNWKKEFPEVFKDGGFDVVIGNPPYGAKFNNDEKEYFRNVYSDIHMRTPESFNYFIYRIENIIKKEAIWGIIIPSSFLYQYEFEKTRKYLLEHSYPTKILNLGDDVFQDVATPTCITILSKEKNKAVYLDIQNVERNLLPIEIFTNEKFIEATNLIENDSYSFIVKPFKELIDKCNNHPKLKKIAEEVATGISSGFDKAYVYTEEQYAKLNLEKSLLMKLIIGGEINRYFKTPFSTKKIIYITSENRIVDFPMIQSTLEPHKERLMKRREAANGKIEWYSLNWPRRRKLFDNPKILIRQTANRILATYDSQKWYCLKSGLIIQLPEHTDLSYEYLLAILNSKLIDFVYQDLVGERGRVFPEVKPVQLFKLPIKIIDSNLQKEVKLKDDLEKNVKKILDENNLKVNKQREFLEFLQAKYDLQKTSKKLNSWHELESKSFLSELKKAKVKLEMKEEMELLKLFKLEKAKAQSIQGEIDKTDREIDKMVYELYGLGEEEIRIVEGE